MYKFILVIFLNIILYFVILSNPVFAVNCSSVPISGSYTASSSCEFANTIDGVDSGSGSTNTAIFTVQSSTTFTISAGQTFAFGSFIPNGTIVITKTPSGGLLRKGALWMTDADADGYPSSTTQIFSATRPTDGLRRNLMTSISSSDCLDSNLNIYTNQTVATDSDQDGYGTSTASSQCAGTSSTVSGRTYYIGSGGTASFIASASMIGSSDCLDSNLNIYTNQTVATDSDQDGYGTSTASSQCAGTSSTVSGRTYYIGSGGTASFIASASMIGSSDCSDSSSVVSTNRTQYTDADADLYTASAGTVCMSASTWGNSACTTAGSDYAKNSASSCLLISTLSGTDCCDSDANAKPGQTAYFSDARATCGGFDYNCDGSSSKEFTSYSPGTKTFYSDESCTVSVGTFAASTCVTGGGNACGNTLSNCLELGSNAAVDTTYNCFAPSCLIGCARLATWSTNTGNAVRCR